MAETDQDAELVRLAQAGNAKAFEALVVKYQRRIARHVARYLKATGDVEDVVQETFIRAYRGVTSFRGDSAFYSWLYRIGSERARLPCAAVCLSSSRPRSTSPWSSTRGSSWSNF